METFSWETTLSVPIFASLFISVNSSREEFSSLVAIFFLKGRFHLIAWAGWMTTDFAFISTVFQSYQDNGQVIMKG